MVKLKLTYNDINLLVLIALDKNVDGVLESLVVKQQCCYIPEHNSCNQCNL